MVVIMKITVFLEEMPCYLVDRYQHFEQSAASVFIFTLKM